MTSISLFVAKLAWVISLTLASPSGNEKFTNTFSFDTAAECIAKVEKEKVQIEAIIKEKSLPYVIADIHCDLKQVEGYNGQELQEGDGLGKQPNPGKAPRSKEPRPS